MTQPRTPNVNQVSNADGSVTMEGPRAELEPWIEWAKEYYWGYSPTFRTKELDNDRLQVRFTKECSCD